MASNVLTVKTLHAPGIAARANPMTQQQGRSYYYYGRARVSAISKNSARVQVRGSQRTPYQVDFQLHDGELKVTCTCPTGMQGPEVTCKHKVAAAFALQDYLRAYPNVTWETILDRALEPPARKTSPQRSILVFSLQNRGSTWLPIPYSLGLDEFPEETWNDPRRVGEIIESRNLSPKAKAVRSRIDASRFVNLTSGAQTVAEFSVTLQRIYIYSYDRSGADSLLHLLEGSVVFTGTEIFPLQRRLEVVAGRAEPQIQLDTVPEGLRIRVRLMLDGEALDLSPAETSVIADEPMWLLSGSKMVQIQDSTPLFRSLIENPELIIPEEERGEFLERYLAPLSERLPVEGAAIEWVDLDEDPRKRLYLSEAQESIRVDLRFAYGDHELTYDRVHPPVTTRYQADSNRLVRVHRRPELEEQTWQSLSDYSLKRGSEPGEFLLKGRTHPVDFLFKQVPRLAEAGFEIYGEQELKSARVNRSRPSLSLKVSSGIDWFDVQTVVSFGDIEVSIKEIRKALRRRERYVKLADGSIGEIPTDWLDRYKHLFALGEETEEGVRLSTHHLALLDQAIADADQVNADDEFERRRQRLREFSNITPHDLPQNLHGELRPYQKAGYDWLHFLHEYEFGGCLADDMGIGKTIQALAFLLSLKESGHANKAALIVMPRSLLFNWKREAERFTPTLRVLVHADQNRLRSTEEFDQYDLVLTTYGIMLRDIEMLRQYRFHYAVLDESQAIKNALSQTARAARMLQADHRLALTGTPVENSTLELWSQFAFLNPGLLGSLDYFRGEFGSSIEKHQDAESANLLRKLVYPFILRRTKDQVAPELPSRTERVLYTEMEPAQLKVYNRWRDYYRGLLLGMIDDGGMNNARMKVLEGLLRLRQICIHPRLVDANFKGPSSKFDLLMETLETLQSEGHKALVFSQFVQMLKIVQNALDARGIPYAYLDGRTKDRQQRVDEFQQDPNIPFFLISLKAGGVGLNLTAADYVIHIDPWWNPAVEMQASDRTHRIGQDKPVFVYKLIVQDSVEEKILQLQERKQELVQQIISTESSFVKSLTRGDVEALFA